MCYVNVFVTRLKIDNESHSVTTMKRKTENRDKHIAIRVCSIFQGRKREDRLIMNENLQQKMITGSTF